MEQLMNTYLGIELKHESELIEWFGPNNQVPTKTKDLAHYLRECVGGEVVSKNHDVRFGEPSYNESFQNDDIMVSIYQDAFMLNIVIGSRIAPLRTLLCIQIRRGLEGQPDTMIVNDADFGVPTADQINQIRLILTFMGDVGDYRPWYEALTMKAEQNKADA